MATLVANAHGILDMYALRARAAPVFVVIIPLVFLIAATAPPALSIQLGGAALVVSVGLSMLVAQLGRSFGKGIERRLWQEWDGPPTTRFLRHRDDELNPILRKRYRERLMELQPSLELSTPRQEAKSPREADQRYHAASRFLIAQTRDRNRFPLVFKENVNYGFLRNLLGLRPLGITTAFLGVLGCAVQLTVSVAERRTPSGEGLLGLGLSVVLLSVWVWWVRPKAVKIAADAYAERLLEALEDL